MMSENLSQYFTIQNFNPEKFVKELSSQCVGAEELRKQRAEIQELSANTSALLKHNVYQNYIQFIETAKEISHLESEMYQLSQLLSEQQSLLSSLTNNRNTNILFEDNLQIEENNLNFESREIESKQKLINLLENVEGAMSLVDTPGRICLHEGSLLELDPMEGTPLKRIHAYLFNDILMIASWLLNSNKRGPTRYKMQVVYDLQTLAVVNVRDLGSVKLAFKLLAFPDTRVFQCGSAISKKEWLEKCDHAKKCIISQENQVPFKDVKKSLKTEKNISVSQSISLDSNSSGTEGDTDKELCEFIPEWILEVTEDLDSYIAQRHFDEAYNLLEKATLFLKKSPKNTTLCEIREQLNSRVYLLVSILAKELELIAEAKSLQGGGLRSAKRAVKLITQLGRSSQACQLYLRLCSASLKARLKRVKREGATVPYIRQLSAIAFSNIVEMCREFFRNFSQECHCHSALLEWCSFELKALTSHLIKQIFIPQVSLSTLVECIITIRDHCEQLTQMGIDFRYLLDGLLRIPLIRALQDTAEKYIDAIKLRAAEDSWKPSNFQSAENFHKILSELEDLGISLPESYIKNDYWIPITNNTLTFSKLFITLLEDCLTVATPEIMAPIEDVIISVLNIQVQHIEISMQNPQLKLEKNLIQDNADYLREIVLTRTFELHKTVSYREFQKLLVMRERLQLESSIPLCKPTPAPRTIVSKYSTTEYI